MNRGRFASTGFALTALLALCGCVPVSPAAWSPPAWPEPQLGLDIEPPGPLRAEDFPELNAQQVRNATLAVQARMAYLPGRGESAAAFNAAIDAFLREAIAEQSARLGVAYRPWVAPRGGPQPGRGCVTGATVLPASEVLAEAALTEPSGVAVVCDIVAAQGGFLGERLRAVFTEAGEVIGERVVVLYADTRTGETVRAEGLWADAAADTLGAALIETFRRQAGSLSLAPADPVSEEQREAITAALATTVPLAGGSFALTLAGGFPLPGFEGLGIDERSPALSVEVPGQVAGALLSDFGRRLLAASGAPFLAPAAVLASEDWADCTLLPCLALTYDDGPNTTHTEPLLDHLREARAPATFYMLGAYAANAPSIVQRTAAEGHEIGVHTWSHPDLRRLNANQVHAQVNGTRVLLQQLSGQPVASFRPPYGSYNARALAAAGLPAILWSVDTRDWEGPSEEVLLRSAIEDSEPGGIVLFHDTNPNSVRLAPQIIDELRARGFTLVTVTTLFGGRLPASGGWWGGPEWAR